MRDWEYLLSGPKLTVGSDYFQLDGKPLPVVGTTYMSGDVSRLYLMLPNAYVWDHDMAQIHAAGLNMIRTGLWTAWKPELAREWADERRRDADGRGVSDVRAPQRSAGAVQSVCVLSGRVWRGEWLPRSGGAAKRNRSMRSRWWSAFHAVPFLAWDLINEPSANRNLWRTLPDYDPFEQAAWRKWIADSLSGSREAAA